MAKRQANILRIRRHPTLDRPTLVLAFTGWMDGGDVSTGTVQRLVELTKAQPIAEIDPEPFFIYNFPGSMEVAALFRPHIEIADGLVKAIQMPASTFYCHESANLVLFVGKEPNMRWRLFGQCIFRLAREVGVQRILFVGSYGGSVPHTREPRLYVTSSDADLLREMEQYGVRRSSYQGPGSFTSYLMTRAPSAALHMASLVAEIPSYLEGRNPSSIAAVTRRLAKILELRLELDSLLAASTRWELQVSSAVERDEQLAAQVRKLEQTYDEELLELGADGEELT
ncbi:MAG: hypothetical protein A2W31_02730 [Planctomycetes bacterium RBG_16_64_10]|nr:MAG: hypothetical protein A2W31_02730 [Planctomycetes bacterium RBG_16_64_10]